MNSQEIKLPAKLLEFYKWIADLSGVPIESVMAVVLATHAFRELYKGKSK